MRNSEKSCQIHMAGEQSGEQMSSKKVANWQQVRNPKGFKYFAVEFTLYLEYLESYSTGRHEQRDIKKYKKGSDMSKVKI